MKRRFSPVLFTIIVLVLSIGVVIVVFVTRQVDEKTGIVIVENATVNNNANGIANVNIYGNTDSTIDVDTTSPPSMNDEVKALSIVDTSMWVAFQSVNDPIFSIQYPDEWHIWRDLGYDLFVSPVALEDAQSRTGGFGGYGITILENQDNLGIDRFYELHTAGRLNLFNYAHSYEDVRLTNGLVGIQFSQVPTGIIKTDIISISTNRKIVEFENFGQSDYLFYGFVQSFHLGEP